VAHVYEQDGLDPRFPGTVAAGTSRSGGPGRASNRRDADEHAACDEAAGDGSTGTAGSRRVDGDGDADDGGMLAGRVFLVFRGILLRLLARLRVGPLVLARERGLAAGHRRAADARRDHRRRQGDRDGGAGKPAEWCEKSR